MRFRDRAIRREWLRVMQQLHVLLSRGFPLAQTFKLLAHLQSEVHWQKILMHFFTTIQSGQSWCSALAAYPHYFDLLACQMINVGEQTGKLPELLAMLIQHRLRVAKLMRTVRQALFYPAIVLSVALIVIFVLLHWMIPPFAALFSNAGITLPRITQIVIKLSEASSLIFLMVMSIFLGCTMFVIVMRQSGEKRKLSIDTFFLRLPGLGHVLYCSQLVRFSRTLLVILQAGIPLVNALQLVSSVMSNEVYVCALRSAAEKMAAGCLLSQSLQGCIGFSREILSWINLGEESGTIENMLEQIAALYEGELEQCLLVFQTLLEPALMMILGSIVGGLLLALYMPIFQLGRVF